jgi:hypothetical protein
MAERHGKLKSQCKQHRSSHELAPLTEPTHRLSPLGFLGDLPPTVDWRRMPEGE